MCIEIALEMCVCVEIAPEMRKSKLTSKVCLQTPLKTQKKKNTKDPFGKGQAHTDFIDQFATLPIPQNNLELSEEDKRKSKSARNPRLEQIRRLRATKSHLIQAAERKRNREIGSTLSVFEGYSGGGLVCHF